MDFVQELDDLREQYADGLITAAELARHVVEAAVKFLQPDEDDSEDWDNR